MTPVKARFLAVLFAAILLLSFSPTTVSALESFGIGALPANPRADNPRTKSIFVYEVQPGRTLTDAIKVINNSPTTKTLSVYPIDSQLSSDGAFACAQAADIAKSVGSWITLEKERVTLKPGTNETIRFTIKVPKGAEVGEHNGCIAIQDLTSRQKDARGIVLSFRSALRVAVTIPGEIKASLQIVAVKTKDASSQKLQISPVLKNDGNVSLDADITVKLVDVFGAAHVASTGQLPVLPRTEAQYNFELNKPFWGGWYQRIVEVNYHQLLQNGQPAKDTHLAAHKEWLYVPPQPGAVALIASLVLAIGVGTIYWVRLRRYQRMIEATKKHYRVREGDNVQAIAEKFEQDWKLLVKLNNLKPPYTLQAGQVLAIPQAHKVRSVKTKHKKTR
ncbi:MAG TPA: LysM peptidoglycan-binding domain-containing protein [Candidatus Saccharimonadales bacterium]